MGDIISQGGNREPSPWPRRLAVVVVLAVAVTVLVVRHLPGRRAAPARPAQAAASATAVPGVATGPALSAQGRPDGVAGPTLRWNRGIQLPVAGVQPAWFWPATGREEMIGGLPRRSSGYLLSRVGGGWAVEPGSGGRECGGCVGPGLPVYFLADGARAVTLAGVADAVAPAAAAGALWLTSYLPGADTATTAGTAREVSSTGTPSGPAISLPAGYAIDQGTSRGLLLAPAIAGPGKNADELWNPATGQVIRRVTNVLAASASEIAWAPSCTARCQVRVLDLVTGRSTGIWLPAGSSAASGMFSPDGHYLALQDSVGSGGDDGELSMQLEVAALPDGRVSVVPGTWASSDALAGFGWPVAGDTLVAELSFTTVMQVVSWQPGEGRPAVADIGPGQNPTSLILGYELTVS